MPTVRYNTGKFSQRAASAAGEYASGTQNPRRSQSEAAKAAKGNWEAGLQAAIAADSFSKGLTRAGDAAWQKGVQEKGRSRYGTGVSLSESKYVTNFEPFKRAIESVSLQPRGPKGTNYARVQAVGEALRAAKSGQ